MNLVEGLRDVYRTGVDAAERYVESGRNRAIAALGGVPEEEYVSVQRELQEAENVEQAYEQVLRSTKHDIGNRLNVVIGRADLAERILEDDDPEYEDALDAIQSVMESADRIDDQLQDLAGLYSDDGPAAIDLYETVVQCVDSYQADARRHDIKLEYHPPEDDDAVIVDAHPMIGRVFDNLLENTFDHADADTAVFDIGQEDGRWRVTYRDDGRGLPPDIYDDITGRSVNGEDSDGDGYGLNIATFFLDRSGADWEIGPPGDGFTMDMYFEPADESEQLRF